MTTPVDSKYLEMSNDELELLVGDRLLVDSFGAQPPTVEARRGLARSWFSQNLATFRAQVCGRDFVSNYMASKHAQDRLLLLGSIMDAIAGFVGVVPVAAAAAMIINYGLESLCREQRS
jgi:hypothetical protein